MILLDVIKTGVSYLTLDFAFDSYLLVGVNGNDVRPTELYSKLINGHNYLVPPISSNISVSVNVELINLLQLVRGIVNGEL